MEKPLAYSGIFSNQHNTGVKREVPLLTTEVLAVIYFRDLINCHLKEMGVNDEVLELATNIQFKLLDSSQTSEYMVNEALDQIRTDNLRGRNTESSLLHITEEVMDKLETEEDKVHFLSLVLYETMVFAGSTREKQIYAQVVKLLESRYGRQALAKFNYAHIRNSELFTGGYHYSKYEDVIEELNRMIYSGY